MAVEKTRSKIFFVVTVLWACAYPGLLKLFSISILSYNTSPSIIKSIVAIIVMLLMFLLPVMSFWALQQIKNSEHPNSLAIRTMLYILVASAPAYILVGTISGLLHVGHWQPWFWLLGLITGFVFICLGSSSRHEKKKTRLNYVLIKKIHRISGIVLLVGFIGLHLLNHATALISVEKHEEIRLLFRSWYASEFVEPILFVIFIIMVVTGLPMARLYMRANSDVYKTLQIGSGIYTVLFLTAHVNAVLSAQYRNVNTDWIFATGEKGLINGYYFLIPYYILSVGMICLHLSTAIRVIVLKKVGTKTANKTFKVAMFGGLIITLIISAAILGF